MNVIHSHATKFLNNKKNVIKMLKNQNIVPTNKPVCLHNNFPRDYVNLRKAIDTNN